MFVYLVLLIVDNVQAKQMEYALVVGKDSFQIIKINVVHAQISVLPVHYWAVLNACMDTLLPITSSVNLNV